VGGNPYDPNFTNSFKHQKGSLNYQKRNSSQQSAYNLASPGMLGSGRSIKHANNLQIQQKQIVPSLPNVKEAGNHYIIKN
jgi:hypothetical protein